MSMPQMNCFFVCSFIINQHMDNNKDRKFIVYVSIAAFLGAAYLLVNYLSNRKVSTSNILSLQKTRKILQEIKYSVFFTCISFSEGLKLKSKTNHSQADLQIFYRTELAKVYQVRQDTVLSRFLVGKDEYAASLEKYKKDQKIRAGQKQIVDMLQNATKGNPPDFTVPRPAKELLTPQQVIETYLEVCVHVSLKIWQKLDQQKQKNPGFNSKDQAHFKKAIRELAIYDIKAQYLAKKGYLAVWGCPNETFYKILESIKQENKELKIKAVTIEKAYEKIVDRITNEPDHLSPERIKFLYDEIVNNKAPEVKPAPQPQPINPVQQRQSQIAPKKSVALAKKESDYNMDELMMMQLLSRSQQQPKKVKEVEVPEPQEKKIQQIKPQAKVEVEVEIVPERVQEVIKVETSPDSQVQANSEQKQQASQKIEIKQTKVEQVRSEPINIQLSVQRGQPFEEPTKTVQKVENSGVQVQKVQNIQEPQKESKPEQNLPSEQQDVKIEQPKSYQIEVEQSAQRVEVPQPQQQ